MNDRIHADVRDFYRSMTPEDRLLLDLRNELYDGSWEEMEQDLEDRLAGRPYVFRLINRIGDDLQRIRRLSHFETTHKLDLVELARRIESEDHGTQEAGSTPASTA